MPPKKNAEQPKEKAECILRYGKHNNVVQWAEEMQIEIEAEYGSIGEFLTTNKSYVYPRVDEAELASALPDSDEESEYEDAEDDDDDGMSEAEKALRVGERAASRLRAEVDKRARRDAKQRRNDKILSKLREGAYEGRRKSMEAQKEIHKKIWPMMWVKMSPSSQSRVKEEEGYALARAKLDCVRLWGFIRETHLTHVFGVGDPNREVNALEQETRFAALKQGEREFISTFKTRFDNQVKANTGAGVPPPTERRLALEFIMKLDTKRYRRMLSQMRNDSLRSDPDAYPSTLAAAYRIASGWTSDETGISNNGIESNSAYVSVDTCFVSKAKDPEKSTLKTAGIPAKSGKKKTEVECHVCGKIGHYARDCEHRKSSKSTEKAHVTAQSDDSDREEDGYDDHNVAMVAKEHCLFSRNELLLDNQASLNVIGNIDLLTNVRKAQRPVSMSGIQAGAAAVRVDMVGDFSDFGEVYYSDFASANILSFAAQVSSGASIRYDTDLDEFSMVPRNSANVYVFSRKDVSGSEGRFYCCDLGSINSRHDGAYVTTVQQNLQRFTKREIDQARKAREMLARMGFPSVVDAMNMVSTGSNFEVSGRDFQIADAIWGKDVPSLKGKTKRRTTPEADISVSSSLVQQQQVLAVDIMFIDKLPFLIGVATPLDLTLATSLVSLDMNKPSRAASVVREAILHFFGVLASQNFKTPLLMVDGEGAISKIKSELNSIGMEVDVSGAGGHVKRVERRIQVVKERVRTHTHHLPFTLPLIALSMCVLYCVSRLNYQPTHVRDGGVSPRETFLGRKSDAKRDFRCAFGDYVMSTVPNTDNTMRARTEDCIVMYPTGNRTGSVKMLSLATGKIVTRDQFRILPTPTSVIERMNELARKDGRAIIRHQPGVLLDSISDTPSQPSLLPDLIVPVPFVGHNHDAVEQQDERDILADNVFPQHPPPQIADTPPEAAEGGGELPPAEYPLDNLQDPTYEHEHEIRGDVEIRGGEAEELEREEQGQIGEQNRDNIEESDYTDNTDESSPAPAKRTLLDFFRTGGSELNYVVSASDVSEETNAYELVHLVTSAYELDRSREFESSIDTETVMNISVKEALRTRGDEAERVILKELGQMLSKKVWTPVHGRALTAAQRSSVIRSSMFLKEKFLATGEFEKLKARLVAGGNEQDKNLYDDLSAPTVSTCAVFTLLSIAAHEGRHAAVVDIGGAFLNAEMKTGVDVHMRLDRTMSDLMVRLSPEYESYRDAKGCIVVQLDRALYGCVESAALWYDSLRETLEGLGYKRNPYDICVFNSTNEQGTQCTAAVHVDDLLITSADEGMITSLTVGLKTRYGEITETRGTVLNYLGMVFDLSHAGEARVTMKGYVEDMLLTFGVSGGARTPATDGLFHQRLVPGDVSEPERIKFHSNVAKAAYLAKRARPDILMPVAYLATRVTRCTRDDMVKLDRLMRYVNETKERGIVLRIGEEGVNVKVYIDAAYGVHADGKSHTGSCVVIGEVGPVHCKSCKQTIVSKSSTEAELIALSDSANQGLHIRNFLIEQGYSCKPVTVYQDNMSCMALIERGRSGAEKTRHIDIRHYWLKERVTRGEAIIKHKGTVDMYANLLTKPLQGSQFVSERNALTGWSSTILA